MPLTVTHCRTRLVLLNLASGPCGTLRIGIRVGEGEQLYLDAEQATSLSAALATLAATLRVSFDQSATAITTTEHDG